ncbi:hypothetical protein CEXT_796441, partial [Caerostris extrusa]
ERKYIVCDEVQCPFKKRGTFLLTDPTIDRGRESFERGPEKRGRCCRRCLSGVVFSERDLTHCWVVMAIPTLRYVSFSNNRQHELDCGINARKILSRGCRLNSSTN